MPTIVIDLDGTLTVENKDLDYPDVLPDEEVVRKLREYRESGFQVTIYTARNMNTYAKSVGKITAFTLPVIIEWLAKHDIPYDEIHIGKPWPDHDGFYVDDRAIRPDEFLRLSYGEIMALTGRVT